MTFVEFIETYQSALATLIVGAIGFWGVIRTINANKATAR